MRWIFCFFVINARNTHSFHFREREITTKCQQQPTYVAALAQQAAKSLSQVSELSKKCRNLEKRLSVLTNENKILKHAVVAQEKTKSELKHRLETQTRRAAEVERAMHVYVSSRRVAGEIDAKESIDERFDDVC